MFHHHTDAESYLYDESKSIRQPIKPSITCPLFIYLFLYSFSDKQKYRKKNCRLLLLVFFFLALFQNDWKENPTCFLGWVVETRATPNTLSRQSWKKKTFFIHSPIKIFICLFLKEKKNFWLISNFSKCTHTVKNYYFLFLSHHRRLYRHTWLDLHLFSNLFSFFFSNFYLLVKWNLFPSRQPKKKACRFVLLLLSLSLFLPIFHIYTNTQTNYTDSQITVDSLRLWYDVDAFEWNSHSAWPHSHTAASFWISRTKTKKHVWKKNKQNFFDACQLFWFSFGFLIYLFHWFFYFKCADTNETHTHTHRQTPFYIFLFFCCVVICGGQKGIELWRAPGCCWQQLGSRHDCICSYFSLRFSHTKGMKKLSLTLLFHLLDPIFLFGSFLGTFQTTEPKIKQQQQQHFPI